MHAFGARTWREILDAANAFLLLHFLCIIKMSKNDQEASEALNLWAREGHDLLGGGADGHAFRSFVTDFFCGDHSQNTESMSQTHLLINNSYEVSISVKNNSRKTCGSIK